MGSIDEILLFVKKLAGKHVVRKRCRFSRRINKKCVFMCPRRLFKMYCDARSSKKTIDHPYSASDKKNKTQENKDKHKFPPYSPAAVTRITRFLRRFDDAPNLCRANMQFRRARLFF